MKGETFGYIAVQATEAVLQAFLDHRDKGLAKLVEFSGADSGINDDCDVFFEELKIKGDLGCFYVESDYFPQTVKRLVKTSKNIGLYMHVWDEYGGQLFLAHTPGGNNFSFFSGGPEADFECEEGDLVKDDDVERWKALIPESVKSAFPEMFAKL
ncbi:hypothetical protein L2750_17930 [Shewanella submarina]|uniref:Uncharacterized protein n=1 Tax=Shewanella submarina TaxID=2016376 RepID=A0ABV7GCJ9_9GAMM|nr:hypothetical protein [Shewanella submarina]MCL1039013.1 hypothetical protein [Shewanella submarina]